ncbi:hypothetical protein DB346_22935 [Verrucomicrobia bacterium LW23]|nr:hypothetical protein DB346_22935 [Verrucomicrobia bacterium LW23]
MEFPNWSQSFGPVRLQLTSRFIVLVDPLIAFELANVEYPAVTSQLKAKTIQKLLDDNSGHMNCLVVEIDDFSPGEYEIDFADICSCDEDEKSFVSVDSAAILVADYTHLASVLAHMEWEVYDECLQEDGDVVFAKAIEKTGGAFFAIIEGGISEEMGEEPPEGHDFIGAGTYILKAGSPRKVG